MENKCVVATNADGANRSTPKFNVWFTDMNIRKLVDLVRSRTDGWDELPTSDRVALVVAEHNAQFDAEYAGTGWYQLLKFSGAELACFMNNVEEDIIEPRTP